MVWSRNFRRREGHILEVFDVSDHEVAVVAEAFKIAMAVHQWVMHTIEAQARGHVDGMGFWVIWSAVCGC